ncbi:hypothetical protein GOODEAATRI_024607 [Goodea atripinnis]|uniref:Uncharacterized protein n=1 Tax=Goodea atripinnis TaxID=208336 RepID=A0ABV0N511_9TELE
MYCFFSTLTYVAHAKNKTNHSFNVFLAHACIFSPFVSPPLVPVLYRTSTPIIFCLSPPTSRHPVWEQPASLLRSVHCAHIHWAGVMAIAEYSHVYVQPRK